MQWNDAIRTPDLDRDADHDRCGEGFEQVILPLTDGRIPAAGRNVSMDPVPEWTGRLRPVPPIVHGEVATDEGAGHGQLAVHMLQGWRTPAGNPVLPPHGNRGLATINRDGSVTWTVYAPDMKSIIYRQLIAPAGSVSPRGASPQAKQRRENRVRSLLGRIPTAMVRRRVPGVTAVRRAFGPPQVFQWHGYNTPGPDLVPRPRGTTLSRGRGSHRNPPRPR